MNYLIVSSDVYNAVFADRRVLAVEFDSRAIYESTYREPIVDVGTAILDRLVWVARSMLEEQVAELHPDRQPAVAGQIRELAGNLSAWDLNHFRIGTWNLGNLSASRGFA